MDLTFLGVLVLYLASYLVSFSSKVHESDFCGHLMKLKTLHSSNFTVTLLERGNKFITPFHNGRSLACMALRRCYIENTTMKVLFVIPSIKFFAP